MKGLKSKITGKGPNLALLHGWSMNSEVWRPVLPLLESSFTVHRIDLPGHGINAECFPGDRLEDWANAAVSVIPAPSIVIGWSLGGLLALAIARQNPACVTHLGLVGCSPKFTAGSDWPHGMRADLLDEFDAGLNETGDEIIKRFIRLIALGDPGVIQLSRRLGSIVNRNARVNTLALRTGLHLLRDEDLRQIFRGLGRPLWVALGDADRLVPIEVVAGLVLLNESVRIDVFENCGHIPFMSYPDMFVRRMQNWLDK